MANNTIKALFTLLRSGLWGKPIDDLSCFPLSEDSWESLYKVARSQTVEGLVYDGIQKLPLAFFPPRNLILTWVVRVDRIELANAQMNKCINEQILFFDKYDIHPILLKGQGIASFYPMQNHRVCGDVDWYFDDSNQVAFLEAELASRNVKVYRSTTNTCSFSWKTLDVELHTRLFDVFSPIARRKLYHIKKMQWDKNCTPIRDSNGYTILPPILNLIQVNLHILKHLLSFGIGLRQFCDSAILYSSLISKYDKEYLLKVYKEIGVIKWINVLHDLLVNYLGLDQSKLPFPLKENVNSEWMIKDILVTGNFGFYDDRHTVKQDDSTIERKNKSQKLWYSFQQYLPLAPYEAISFPFVHFIERFKSLTFG